MSTFDLGQIGPDTQLQAINDRVVVISVHLTNISKGDMKPFMAQTAALKALIESEPYRNKTIIVTGDFNA
jgi:endonuclease/exonuclease/phosphatase family metal-dependent hydrolase